MRPTRQLGPWGTSRRPGRRGFPPAIARRVTARDPLCQLSLPGCTETSTEADHIMPDYLARAAGWTDDEIDSEDNGQGVCHSCHKQKTARESAAARRTAAQRRPQRKRLKRPHPGIS